MNRTVNVIPDKHVPAKRLLNSKFKTISVPFVVNIVYFADIQLNPDFPI